MVQFIGVNFRGDRVETTVVDRKARLLLEHSAAIAGGAAPAAGSVRELPPQEWVRAGGLALEDTYNRLPPRERKLWGIGLAGPAGWIAIDPAFDPLTPIRLTGGDALPGADLARWIASNPRIRSRIFAILSPKDYFRFRISGGLATDATEAWCSGFLREGQNHWSASRLEEAGLSRDWFPPVFECAAATGRLSEAGVELTGIPGGVWLVAGAQIDAAAELAAGDLGTGDLYVALERDRLVLRLRLDGRATPAPIEGWEPQRAALPGRLALARTLAAPRADDADAVRSVIREAIGALRAGGLTVRAAVLDSRDPAGERWTPAAGDLPVPTTPACFAGRADPGAAFLAALAKPIFRNTADLHRKIAESLRAGPSTAAGAANSPGPPAAPGNHG